MVIKNPETGRIFFYPGGVDGFKGFHYENNKYYVYKLENNLLRYVEDGEKELTDAQKKYAALNFSCHAYAIEINAENNLKYYKTKNSDIPFEFNVLEISFLTKKIKYKEMKLNNTNASKINFNFHIYTDVKAIKSNLDVMYSIMNGLYKDFPEYHFSEVCTNSYFSHHNIFVSYKNIEKSPEKLIDFDVFKLLNHVYSYNTNNKYREMVDNGFSSIIYSFSGLNKGNINSNIGKYYKFLKGRKYSEMVENYSDICCDENYTKDCYVKLFYKHNIDKQLLDLFERIFNGVNTRAVNMYEKIKNIINTEIELPSNYILNKLDIFMSYIDDNKVQRASYHQFYKIFEKIYKIIGREELSKLALTSYMNYTEWQEYLNQLIKNEKYIRKNTLLKKMSAKDYRRDCIGSETVLVYLEPFVFTRINDFNLFSDNLTYLITDKFAENFDKNDVLYSVKNSKSELIGIIKLNIKTGESEIINIICSESNLAKKLDIIKDEIFKFCHPIFLNRELN